MMFSMPKDPVMRLGLSILLAVLGAAAQPLPRPGMPESGANLPAQIIGANDLIAVSVYDTPELTRTVRVGEDGSIRLPMLQRRIHAAGLMPVQLEAAIVAALKAERILIDPLVTVTMAEYNSRPIQVAGAVKKPVTFQAVGHVTLLEALARAEGLREDAGSEILVSTTQPGENGKGSTLTRRIPVQGLIDAADPELNLTLSGGEDIRVPEAGRIFVVGNVKKPGAYPLRNGAECSILQALAYSEGLMPFAAKQAFIYRREASGSKNELPIELEQIMKRKAPDVPQVANDIQYIPDNKGRRLCTKAIETIVGIAAGGGALAVGYSVLR